MSSDFLIVAVVIFLAVFLIFKLRGQYGIDDAKAALAKGAVIVDVRTPSEYAEGKVEGSVNIPLDGVVEGVAKRFSNKETVLLCHCTSGMRSATAVKELKRAGYPNAFNLGSYPRALKLTE